MTYAHDIIIRPIISEQSMEQIADKKYDTEMTTEFVINDVALIVVELHFERSFHIFF